MAEEAKALENEGYNEPSFNVFEVKVSLGTEIPPPDEELDDEEDDESESKNESKSQGEEELTEWQGQEADLFYHNASISKDTTWQACVILMESVTPQLQLQLTICGLRTQVRRVQ